MIQPRPDSIRSGREAKGKLPLSFSAADRDQDNSADQTDSAYNRRKTDSMTFGVLDFKRTKLRVFLFFGPAQAAPGKANNPDDDQNDADNSSWFHGADATATVDR